MVYLYCQQLIKLFSSSVDVWLLLGRHQDPDSGSLEEVLPHPKARMKKKKNSQLINPLRNGTHFI